jgi:hypothetical protein
MVEVMELSGQFEALYVTFFIILIAGLLLYNDFVNTLSDKLGVSQIYLLAVPTANG